MNNISSIQNSLEFIENNLDKKIKLQDLAKRAYLSEFYFHRLFHTTVGDPVMEYIRKRRLSEAAKDLSSSNEKITDIALKYQFGSGEAFSRAFKKTFGVSPRDYKNGNAKILLYRRADIASHNSQTIMSSAAA